MSTQPRCNWCGVFVARWMPAFTWHRDWATGDIVGGKWVKQGEHLCWTDPQRLCPDCAYSASHVGWCDIFAEVEP